MDYATLLHALDRAIAAIALTRPESPIALTSEMRREGVGAFLAQREARYPGR